MAQIECPYCRHVYELCTDDGHGVDTDITHEEECVSCGKYFTFRTEVTYSHYCSEAECLNGEKHILKFERSNWGANQLVFRCKTCDGRFDTESHPVLKNLFFNGEASSDFEFDKSLFHQFVLAIEKATWNCDWTLQSYLHWTKVYVPYYKTFSDMTGATKLKHLLDATEAKETIMRAFAKLFTDECADIYRC